MDINHLAIDINEWANSAFPKRTPQAMFLKLYGEIAEMIEADDDHVGDEIADVLIMILDYAKMKGVNPSTAIQRKMKINRGRTWAVNKLGAFSHVKDTPRLPGTAGIGSSNEAGSGQAMAHDRHDENPESCRAHGQCRAVGLADCAQFPGDVLGATKRFAECNGPRSCGNVSGGHPDTLQGIDREISDQDSGIEGAPIVFRTAGGQERFRY